MRALTLLAASIFCTFVALSAHAQQLLVEDENWDRRDIYFTEALESIIFPPNPRWEDLSSFPNTSDFRISSSPVGRLKIRKSGGVSLCTGFLVGNGLLMTNNHCVSDDGSASAVVVEMGYYSRSGRLKRYEVSTQPILTNKDKDISILSVRGNPEGEWGFVQFSARNLSEGEELFIVHHPGGQPKKLSRVGCFVGPDRNLRHGRFLHQCDTVGGSSGSPIFDAGGSVVGIHHRGTPDRGQDAFNQGTQFMLAKEFIDMLQPTPAPAPLTQQNDGGAPQEDDCLTERNGVAVWDQKCRLKGGTDELIEI